MSEFEKLSCTCAHGYTCRSMQDPNCCAHSCDYNDLVDTLNAVQSERDALAHRVKDMQIAHDLAKKISPTHDAEVAKKAVQAALRMYGNTDLSNKEIIALSENYAASLNK